MIENYLVLKDKFSVFIDIIDEGVKTGKSEDNTMASGKLLQTGSKYIIEVEIILSIILLVICYRRYRKNVVKYMK